ncbi:AAWKG family protein, partial [Streptomyces sp. NPDC001941]|uniref:AAWKG family protein n=1 Tax=Streptomyces sp. NPDC001941 TaxID=3154659 RepID=UPI0033174B26
MADRYDPKSVDNVTSFNDNADPGEDRWATLVKHITGYPMPDRSKVFDTLRSDHGGKLFRMDIKERSLSLLVKDSGFLTNKGEDYDIWFFDSGKKRSIMQARIVFEGRVKSGDEIIFDSPGTTDDVRNAQVREGNDFTDYNKDKMSTKTLAQYMNGPRKALLELLDSGTTEHARFSSLGVPGPDIVDLGSFTTTGESFDFAAAFFTEQAPVLKDWEDRFGRDDASWKGEAADVFRSLIKKIRENYDSYVETFNSKPSEGDGTGKTVYSRALSLGKKYMEDAARDLLKAWLEWANSPYYDPHRVLRYVLDDLAIWVDQHNVTQTDIKSTTTRYTTTVSHSPKGEFTQVHPEYGDLTDIANWAKVGDKAARMWTQAVDEHLGGPAAKVQAALNNHFVDLGADFSDNVPKPKSTSTASDEYEKKKAKEEQDEIKKQNEENKKYQEELRKEQEKQREEDKKYQEELRKEQEEQREEDKKYQEELRAEQKAQREEDKKLQDDLRKEQNEQRDEDKKYAEELRDEQKREQEEAKKEAEAQQKAVTESLGGLNDPNSPKNQDLDINKLLGDKPVTESLGDLKGLNQQGGNDGTQPPPVTTNLGSPLGLNPGGNANAPGGPNSKNNDALNDEITKNLGSIGDLNGSHGSVDTPTGGSTRLDSDKLTTDFPDGSSTSFDPKTGVVTTTHPDGSVTTQDLGNGTRLTNPDGSVTSLGDDGKLTTTFPDGSRQVADPSTGQVTSTDPDGRTTTQNLGNLGDLNHKNGLDGLPDLNPDLPTETTGDLGHLGDLNSGHGLATPTGGHVVAGDNGFTTTFPDGSTSVFNPDNGTLVTTHPDGSTTTTDLTHGAKVANPDGSSTVLDNGHLKTTFPDGSSQSIDPDTGVTTVTDPQGHTRTVDLDGLNSQANQDRTDLLDELRGLGSHDGPNAPGGGGGGDGVSTRDLDLSGLGVHAGATGSVGDPGGLGASFAAQAPAGAGVAPLTDGAGVTGGGGP